jgi:glycosyltransferase involved in cell wall biosynthesis
VRIVYYTHSAFFEPALCLVAELSRHVEVDLLLELAPGAWETSAFDLRSRTLPGGIIPADPVLADAFPAGVRKYWKAASSFHLVVHPSRRSLHPSSWSISRHVLLFAAGRRADVLHIDDVDVSPRLALALPMQRRPPIVMSVHDPEPHSGEEDWRKKLARRLAYPVTDRFVLYSAAAKAEFARRHGLDAEAIVVARLGVYSVFREWLAENGGRVRFSEDPRENRTRPRFSAPTVMFFGRISPYKGLDVFYEAAILIAKRLPSVKFVVAGRPIEGYTPPVPPRLDGASAVEVLQRYLTSAETARLFQRASVVACPYRDATQSGVVLTAYAFRVPVVAAAVGGMPEYVVPEKTGLLVPVGDARAIADAAVRVLSDDAFARRLREGTAAAENGELSWRNTASVLLETYEQIARK